MTSGKQSQKAGNNATQIQAQIVNINYGVTEAKDKKIAIIADNNTDNIVEDDSIIKVNRKHKHIFKKILVTISAIVILSIVGFVGYKAFSSYRYDSICKTAKNELNSGNYLEASKLFNQAASISSNDNDFVEATCSEADCYVMLGILDQLYGDAQLDPFISNYDKAIQIYYRIISNDEEYKDTEFFYDAAAGLSICYLYCAYPTTDSRWKKAIEIMEQYSDTINSESDPNQTIIIYNALWQYYEHLSNESYENKLDPDIASKLQKYLSEFTVLLSIQHYYDGLINGSDVYLLVRSLEHAIAFSISIGKPQEYLPFIIIGCNSIINRIEEKQINVDAHCYFSAQCVLAKANIYMGMIYKKGKRMDYYNEAYHILSKLLINKLKIEACDLSDVAYYCILTGMCTADDLCIIELLMDEITAEIFNPDLDEKNIHLSLEILTIYSGILELYEYSEKEKIFQKGSDLIEKLSASFYYMQTKDSENYTIYEKYFHKDLSRDYLPIVELYEHNENG